MSQRSRWSTCATNSRPRKHVPTFGRIAPRASPSAARSKQAAELPAVGGRSIRPRTSVRLSCGKLETRQPLRACPTVSAILGPRFPIGFGEPVVVSRMV